MMCLSYLNDPDSIYMKIFDLAYEVAADTGGPKSGPIDFSITDNGNFL